MLFVCFDSTNASNVVGFRLDDFALRLFASDAGWLLRLLSFLFQYGLSFSILVTFETFDTNSETGCVSNLEDVRY